MSQSGRRYQRRGEVHARRLEQDMDWTTDLGDPLHGEAGHWVVTKADGKVHTVTPEAFAASYARIEGDRYQRVGVFQARQATETETIATLEGPATAAPGYWVVTDTDGNSWPVPDETFRAGYEPID